MIKKMFFAVSLLFFTLGAWSLTPPLPQGATAEWRISKAWNEKSSQRETICLNGLWQWRSEYRVPETAEEQPVWRCDVESGNVSEWSFWKPSGAAIDVSADTSRKTAGEACLKIGLDIPEKTNLYHIVRYFKNLPRESPLCLTIDVFNQVNAGKMVFELQDARGYEYFCMSSKPIAVKDVWQTCTISFMLPRHTTEVKLIAARIYGENKRIQGSLWVDNLRIFHDEHGIKGSVPLPADENWGYTKVPGSWRTQVWVHESDTCQGNAKNAPRGWYRRTVEIPKNWRGRRILLHFDAFGSDGIVFANGREAGTLGYTGGEVDITDFAEAGKKLEVAVLVEARNVRHLMPLVFQNTYGCEAGINGDVFLKSIPQGVHLGDIRITTTVEPQKVLKVEAPLLKAAEKDLTYRCDVSVAGAWMRSFSFSGVLPAGETKLVAECICPNVELWDIKKPRLHTLKLSLLDGGECLDESLPIRFGFREFKIDGKYFKLNGIKLNLVPCAYWPVRGNWHTKEAMRHWLEKAIAAGYNYVYTDKLNYPGRNQVAGHFLDICDELGILAGVDTLSIGSIARAVADLTDSQLAENKAFAQWGEAVAHIVKPNLNHPSLVMWRMNMNGDCYPQDQNPLFLDGKKDFAPGSRSEKLAKAMLKSNDFVRSLDSTRPIYNHACGKTGDIYTLNNYLGWPELQDLREWLKVWAADGDKPLFMVEQATPYPGDFQMRDPTHWWKNEPLLVEYGAILLGDDAYRLEEESFVDYPQTIWNAKMHSWGSSYHKYCNEYPKIIDQCTSEYYEAMLPAWRTWGISGGVNAWENCWRRLKTGRKPASVPLKTPWKALQRPGYDHHEWEYDNGGGGEIRTLFDLDREEEAEYFEPTKRSQVMPALIAPLYAYIGGPKDRWFTVEHAYRALEPLEKSIVLINDSREAVKCTVSWRCVKKGETVASGKDKLTVAPGCVGFSPVVCRLPYVKSRADFRLEATVNMGRKKINVKPFNLQVFPSVLPALSGDYSRWALFDPRGKTTEALRKRGVTFPTVSSGQELPPNLEVLVIGCGALVDSAVAFPELADRVRRHGMQVLVFEQSAQALTSRFGLRAFTPGVRQVNLRCPGHPVLDSLLAEDFRDWRGQTTLGPLAEAPESLNDSQWAARVWRCSLEGVVASTIVEKPHQTSCRPLLDGGFDLRYMMLWEVASGNGRMVFCQLDVTDRIGKDPVADTLFENLLHYVGTPLPRNLTSEVDVPTVTGKGKVLVLKSGGELPNGKQMTEFLWSGGTVIAAGLTMPEAEQLAAVGQFQVVQATCWKNSLDVLAPVPKAFAGVSPAEIHWRRKVTVPVVRGVRYGGWRNPTGVLAEIPVGHGRIVWISGSAEEFKPEERPDLIFSRVNSKRLLTTVLHNAGLIRGADWAAFLTADGTQPDETLFYADKRTSHDDPYTYMRW